ncbi:MAG: hypothetical protein IJ638_01580 [Alphaproteobacteria bacterium]|nr:hypothetical protein [Alphaproteobacteria bacterium]
MKKIVKFFAVGLGVIGVFSVSDAFSREARRSSKLQKASNAKDSAGLRVKAGTSSKGSSGACGANAVLNSLGTACECKDATNFVINVFNPNECLQKTDPVVISHKKACGNVFLTAINRECEISFANNGMSEDGTFKCYDANDLFLKFDTSSLVVYVDGTQYAYDKVCYLYTEDLAKSIADDYSITGVNSPNCKLKRVVADASSECFQAVLAAGKAYGATNAISSDLQKICGYTGLHAKWAQLFGNDDSSKVNFPKNIPDLYLQAGKLSSADGVALVGNILDGKMTDKSNTWELNITQVLNSHLKDVSVACGSEYAISEHNTDLQLSNEKSSLARAIDEKGALKGAQDWAMMQASVVIGEDKANKVLKKGILGMNDDTSKEDKSDIIVTVLPVENFDNLSAYYDKLNSDGRYVLTTDKKYAIIDVVKNTAGGDELEYTNVNYSDDIDLSKDALKAIIGKEQEILSNGKLQKGDK